VEWSPGDLFTIGLKDTSRVVGQALDLMMPNVVSVALTDIRLAEGAPLPDANSIGRDRIMAALSATRHPLDSGHWPIVGHRALLLQRREWPNEQYRSKNWVGAKMENGASVEAFLNAYHGLAPWDLWVDPLFFDKLLFAGRQRPPNVIFSKS